MTFEIVRILLSVIAVNIEDNIYDFKVIIYPKRSQSIPKEIDKLMATSILYRDIPDCFNCLVHSFDIDLEEKAIFIKSEVVKNGKR